MCALVRVVLFVFRVVVVWDRVLDVVALHIIAIISKYCVIQNYWGFSVASCGRRLYGAIILWITSTEA